MECAKKHLLVEKNIIHVLRENQKLNGVGKKKDKMMETKSW